jgi:hypothetical protein
MDLMRKIPERYRGIAYFLLGGFFLFLALRISSGGNAPAAQSASTPNESSSQIPFFIIGMAIPAILFFALKRKSTLAKEETKPQSFSSSEDYKGLVDQARNAWSLVSRNNRLYLGSLVVSWGANKFGEISGHPLFGNSSVIAFVYTLAFFACIQQLVKGKKLEERITAYSIDGIQLEKKARKTGYFHEIAKGPQGFEIFMLIFFRIVIPVWLLYCAIDFGLMSASKALPQWSVIAGMSVILTITGFFLWNLGCRPSFLLSKRMQELAT